MEPPVARRASQLGVHATRVDGFGFAAAAALAGYLERLGVSHLYSSPSLQAAPGTSKEGDRERRDADPHAAVVHGWPHRESRVGSRVEHRAPAAAGIESGQA